MEKRYNGLGGDLKALSQFVFIYEKQIKVINKNQEFKDQFPSAYKHYERKIKKHLQYVKAKELAGAHEGKKREGITLVFTKNKVMITDLCGHIRNSICHALICKRQNKVFIEDKNSRKMTTSTGFLDYFEVIEFLVAIIRDYI